MEYRFTTPDHLTVRRSDGGHVPWNPTLNEPRNIDGYIGKQWKEDGSPIPDAYVAPSPSPEDIRRQEFAEDQDLQEVLDAIKDASPAEIKEWVEKNATTQQEMVRMFARMMLLLAAKRY